jgi:3-oxoacyl-(acyl-carrier-protein) synthase
MARQRLQQGVPEVAITGLGLVSALGLSVDESIAQALSGKNGIRRYTASWSDGAKAELTQRVGGMVEGFDPTKFIDPKFSARYEPAVNFAVGAAEEALSDSGLFSEDGKVGAGQVPDERFGCVIGSGLPGAELWHRALHLAYAEGKPNEVPGYSAISISGNCAPSVLALRHKLQGPSFGVVNACASGATAISLAADQIRCGRADRMLAGGAESSARSLVAFASFAAAGGMNVTDDPDRASLPFSLGRRGFVLGEGSGMLLLERLDLALARGAKIYGVLSGEGHTNDAHHIINPEPSGTQWARVMSLALQAAHVSPDEVDVISAHAAGTQQGDVAETRAIVRVFGERAKEIPVSATKSMHGHTFGASASVETVLALAAMRRGYVLPTINLNEPDPECHLDYVPNQARKHRVRVMLKNSFGAGGAATCLVIKTPSSLA